MFVRQPMHMEKHLTFDSRPLVNLRSQSQLLLFTKHHTCRCRSNSWKCWMLPWNAGDCRFSTGDLLRCSHRDWLWWAGVGHNPCELHLFKCGLAQLCACSNANWLYTSMWHLHTSDSKWAIAPWCHKYRYAVDDRDPNGGLVSWVLLWIPSPPAKTPLTCSSSAQG